MCTVSMQMILKSKIFASKNRSLSCLYFLRKSIWCAIPTNKTWRNQRWLLSTHTSKFGYLWSLQYCMCVTTIWNRITIIQSQIWLYDNKYNRKKYQTFFTNNWHANSYIQRINRWKCEEFHWGDRIFRLYPELLCQCKAFGVKKVDSFEL